MTKVKSVEAHDFDREMVIERLPDRIGTLKKFLAYAREDPDELDRVISEARAVAAYQGIVDPSSSELRRALRLSTQSAVALFALASKPKGSTLKVELGDGSPVILSTGPIDASRPSNWYEGYYAATLLRDGEALTSLCDTPVKVFKASGAKMDAFNPLLVATLKAVAQKKSNRECADLLQEALAATDEASIKHEDFDYVLNITVQVMELLFRVLDRDAAGFNASLVKALERHKKYWTDYSEQPPQSPYALFALGPTAIAALAHDRGMEVAVRSPYMPMPLVEGKA